MHNEVDFSISSLLNFGPIEDLSQGIIKVIGVGGGGCNAVSIMYDEGIQGVSFAVVNTDSSSLAKSSVPMKIQLGDGLGVGGKPEKAKMAAEQGRDMLDQLFDDTSKMIFVTATMGGGTGTGAAPVVAAMAKERGLLTIGVVTIPFYFEHTKKIKLALQGVEELRKNVDALLIINNERLCDVYSETGISLKDGFKKANDVLQNAVKGIAELITVSTEGDINLDFCDVETTMRNGGGAIMAVGKAKGDHRVECAILEALESPLLYGNDIGRAKRILFNIYSSESHPLLIAEMNEINGFFDQLDNDIEVIWGTQTDNSLGEEAKVIILASDIPDDILHSQAQQQASLSEEEHYERLIRKLYLPAEIALNESPDDIKDEGEIPRCEPEFNINLPGAYQTDNGNEVPTGSQPTSQITHNAAGKAQEPVVNKWKRWLNRQLNTIISDVTDSE